MQSTFTSIIPYHFGTNKPVSRQLDKCCKYMQYKDRRVMAQNYIIRLHVDGVKFGKGSKSLSFLLLLINPAHAHRHHYPITC